MHVSVIYKEIILKLGIDSISMHGEEVSFIILMKLELICFTGLLFRLVILAREYFYKDQSRVDKQFGLV